MREADFGRGKEGVLYFIRDILLALCIIYACVLIAYDCAKNRNYTTNIFPVAGVLFAALGAAIDTGFVYTGVNFDFFPHEYFSRFSLGITLLILCLLSGLTRDFINAAREVEKAHRRVLVSEEKYRILVEGTEDLIFTLNDDTAFLTANRAAMKLLCLAEPDFKIRRLSDVIYFGSGLRDKEEPVILEKIESLRKMRKPVSVKVMLRGAAEREPKEYLLRMENVISDGKEEILCRGAAVPENTLARLLVEESQKYTMGNYLYIADDLSKRLVSSIVKYCEHDEMLQIRIALREIIINSIEHGNLNISFDEKTEALETNTYMEFIERRQNDPLYRDRTASIRYSLSGERVIYVIEDDGPGFDFISVMDRVRREANTGDLDHGRGLMIAHSVFDSVSFNETGNKVTLIKNFNNAGG
ncbi:MAG: ATP-binding protein [Spirochaetota bacterium]